MTSTQTRISFWEPVREDGGIKTTTYEGKGKGAIEQISDSSEEDDDDDWRNGDVLAIGRSITMDRGSEGECSNVRQSMNTHGHSGTLVEVGRDKEIVDGIREGGWEVRGRRWGDYSIENSMVEFDGGSDYLHDGNDECLFSYVDPLMMLPPPIYSDWMLKKVAEVKRRLGYSFKG